MSLLLLLSLLFSMFNMSVFAEGNLTASLKVSEATVHSGTKFTLTVELSSAAANDIDAEISDGKKTYSVRIPSGGQSGSVEMTAGKSDKAVVKTYTLNSSSAFTSEKSTVSVRILPKPAITFNASFLMASVGKQIKVYFKCKNATQMTVALPISLRAHDGTVLQQYSVDTSHTSFEYSLKIDKDWEFPYSLEVHNELTDTTCATIPVMVTDLNKPGIRKVETTEKKIALGFDCGYNNKFTDYILDTMDEYDAKVTFFVTGFFCKGFPDQLTKIHERGHEIGNHTMQHLRMANLPPEDIYKEIQGVNDLVREATDVSPVIMRPPYGSAGATVVAISRMTGCETVFWTMDSYDWDPKVSADEIIERATKNMGEGCILLFHNSAPKTKQTLKVILDDYKAKGLKIVPVSELLYDGHYLVDEKGTQKPDPNYVKITGSELVNGRKFTVKAEGDGINAELKLNPVFSGDAIYRDKNDIAKIQADQSLLVVSYDFGEPVSAPVKKGETIGNATFSYNHQVWFTAEMHAANDVLKDDEKQTGKKLPSSEALVSPSDTAPKTYPTDVYIGINVLIIGLVFLVACYRPAILSSRRHCIMSHRQG